VALAVFAPFSRYRDHFIEVVSFWAWFWVRVRVRVTVVTLILSLTWNHTFKKWEMVSFTLLWKLGGAKLQEPLKTVKPTIQSYRLSPQTQVFPALVVISPCSKDWGMMALASRCCSTVVTGLLAILLLCADQGDTARGGKRRRCMVLKNEWRSKGFGDNQQVPSSPISGEHKLSAFSDIQSSVFEDVCSFLTYLENKEHHQECSLWLNLIQHGLGLGFVLGLKFLAWSWPWDKVLGHNTEDFNKLWLLLPTVWAQNWKGAEH